MKLPSAGSGIWSPLAESAILALPASPEASVSFFTPWGVSSLSEYVNPVACFGFQHGAVPQVPPAGARSVISKLEARLGSGRPVNVHIRGARTVPYRYIEPVIVALSELQERRLIRKIYSDVTTKENP